MIKYIQGRLLSLVISLFFSSIIIFFVIEKVPGDPASFMLGINASDETVEALKLELGLEKSGFRGDLLQFPIRVFEKIPRVHEHTKPR